ncbi:MAG TPA: rRNA adenine N(6)-methyltransferase family protein [Gaiellaceae bacterium]
MAVRPRAQRGRGTHFLRSSKLAAELVRAAGIRQDDFVLDLGAGAGALTTAIARTRARVVAVEIDPHLAASLRSRCPDVEVRVEDALHTSLPREPFKVVSNLPFDGATAILRRLLDPRLPLASADVIVEWGMACKRAAVWPGTQLSAYWGAWFELSVVRRLPASVFAPPPSVDAGLLRLTRRAEPLVPLQHGRAYEGFLTRGYHGGPRSVVPEPVWKRCESELGFDRRARARDLDAHQWAELFLRVVRPPR